MQNNLAEGGFTGITLLLYALFHISPSISNLVLNIPIFFIGWRMLGRTMFVYTLIGTVSLSVFLSVFQRYEIHMPLSHDLALAALFAGVFIGAGLGIIFKYGGTTGGVDIIARLINKFSESRWAGRCLPLTPVSFCFLCLRIFLTRKRCTRL